MGKSLNKVLLIGNLTKDPELKYTPGGKPIVTTTVATNRQWKNSKGEPEEESEYTPLVAWDKTAELLSELGSKETKIYIEGRLSTRKWNDKEGIERKATDVVVFDFLILEKPRT